MTVGSGLGGLGAGDGVGVVGIDIGVGGDDDDLVGGGGGGVVVVVVVVVVPSQSRLISPPMVSWVRYFRYSLVQQSLLASMGDSRYFRPVDWLV